MQNRLTKIIIPCLLIVLGFISRLLPHPANFAPIGAIALFAGIYLPKKWSLVLPIVAMFISDIFVGFYSWQIMLAVYISFGITGVIGLIIKNHKKFSTVVGGTVLGSIIFFLVTNASVWIFGTMYTHNFSGLIQSYLMAIPFFRNSLLGDLFYVGIMVGGYEMYQLVINKKQLAENKSQI